MIEIVLFACKSLFQRTIECDKQASPYGGKRGLYNENSCRNKISFLSVILLRPRGWCETNLQMSSMYRYFIRHPWGMSSECTSKILFHGPSALRVYDQQ